MTRKTLSRLIASILLLLVCVVSLASPLYNRTAPPLFGVSFFVWFQFLWIIVAAMATGLVYRFLPH